MNGQEVSTVKRHSFESDVAYDEKQTLEDAIASVIPPGVTWSVVSTAGPGGWPEVRFSSQSAKALRNTAIALCDGDEEQAEEVLSEL